MLTVPVELRASAAGPMLRGVILTEGRAASGGRAELFTPGAVRWPADGIAIRLVHLGPAETRAVPTRGPGGEIRISTRATPSIFRAVSDGARYMSVEFHALDERTTPAGVREIRSALVTGAIVTDDPEYDSTAAELRQRGRRKRRVKINGQWVYVDPEFLATLEAGDVPARMPEPAAQPATIRDRGEKPRKRGIVRGAFSYVLQDRTREIALMLGRDHARTLATRSSGALKLTDDPDALRFAAEVNPDVAWVADFLLALRSEMHKAYVTPMYRIPPAATVPDAVRIVKEPDSMGGAEIEVVQEAVLTGLSLDVRAGPGKTPIEIREIAPARRRRVWL